MAVLLVQAAFLTLLVGAAVTLALGRERHGSGWAAAAGVAAAGLLLWGAAIAGLRGPAEAVTLFAIAPLRTALVVRVDPLSAVFLAVIGTIAPLTVLYSVRYLERFPNDSVAKYYPVLQVTFAGIVGVVATSDLLFFLVFWELMTLASDFLVAFDRENAEAQRAALKYFVVNQAAALGMLAVALVLGRGAGSFEFAALRDAMATMLASSPAEAHLLLALLFLGFATKAGALPMGSWLVTAYPAAPTSATAAIAGTMSKLGIYGLLRVFLELLPLSSATTVWGVIIAVTGVANMFVGTLTALRQDDVKKLMSFHVIGQVGYIMFGVGTGLALLRADPLLAALALVAGTFHLINNALYKTGLFLSAGAVEYRVGTRALGELPGGLGAAMAGTAACSVVAALAIAGVPPLNGFASKWMLYGTGILGARISWTLPVAALVALFISLATLASFLKYLGGTFLGGGAPASVRGGEVPWSMLLPQVALAVLCVAIGVFPGVVLDAVHAAILALPAGASLGAGALSGGVTGIAVSRDGVTLAAWQPLPVLGALALLGALAWFGLQRAGGARRRRVPVWLGGELETGAAIRYAPHSYYRPFKEAFQGVYPVVHLHAPILPPSARRSLELDWWLYVPLARAVMRAARLVSRAHVGLLQVYLLWIILGAAVVTAVLLFAGGT